MLLFTIGFTQKSAERFFTFLREAWVHRTDQGVVASGVRGVRYDAWGFHPSGALLVPPNP